MLASLHYPIFLVSRGFLILLSPNIIQKKHFHFAQLKMYHLGVYNPSDSMEMMLEFCIFSILFFHC